LLKIVSLRQSQVLTYSYNCCMYSLCKVLKLVG